MEKDVVKKGQRREALRQSGSVRAIDLFVPKSLYLAEKFAAVFETVKSDFLCKSLWGFLLVLVSCGRPAGKNERAAGLASHQYSGPCAFIYTADAPRLKIIKNLIGAEDFSRASEINSSNDSAATRFLQAQGLKVYHSTALYVGFQCQSGQIYYVDVPDRDWKSLYLFDGSSQPARVPLDSVKEFYADYFRH